MPEKRPLPARSVPVLRLTLAALVAAALTTSAIAWRAGSLGDAAGAAARDWYDSLDAGQQAEAVQPFEAASRVGWHFIPMDDRKGVPLSEMTDEQRQLVHALGRTLLSDIGATKTEQVMALEGLVARLEGEGRRWPRDPALYYVTLFGDPAEFGQGDAKWGLSFEGHHVSLNFTLRGDTVVDSTPQFLGAHPATVKRDPAGQFPPGTQVLEDEEKLGFELLAMLDDEQRKQAVIAEEPPREVLTAGEAQPLAGDAKGLAASDMTAEQQATLRKLIGTYTEVVADPLAKRRLAAMEESFGAIRFAWAGGDQPGQPHYYRIEGPSLEIELANTQPDAEGNPVNHLHVMYRDNRGDFGLDELAAE